MKKIKHLVLFLFVFLMAFGGTKVFASGTITVPIVGKSWPTGVRPMLEEINKMRTSSATAWYWNEDNTTKTQFADNQLCELTYDYELEAIAIQRAAELVVRWSHTRPNGGSVYDLMDSSHYYKGENLAMGQDYWYDAFVDLAEEDCDYDGQGHRRNMLNPNFKSVGMARFYYNSTHYYVQVFSSRTANTTATPAEDGDLTVNVEILASASGGGPLIEGDYSTTNGIMTVSNLDDKLRFSPDTARFSTSFTNDDGTKDTSVFTYPTKVTYEISDESVAVLDENNYLNILKTGSFELTCTYEAIGLKNIFTINTTFEYPDFTNATITLDKSSRHYFTGKEICPAITSVTLRNSDFSPVEGVHYTAVYSDNIHEGYGWVTITGINGCTGKASIVFRIYEQSIQNCTIDPIPDQNYTGSALTPAVVVKLGDVVLTENTDYRILYSSNVIPGTAKIDIQGLGDLYGYTSTTFNITGTIPDNNNNNTGTGNTGTGNTGTGNTGSDTTGNVLPKGTSVSLFGGAKVTVTTPASAGSSGTVSYTPSKGAIILTIPDTVTLNNLTYKVTSIPANAFKNNTKLTKVTIGKYVTSIGNKAFYGCSNLTTVKIGKSVTTIGNYAFAKCTSLKKIAIPSKVTKIGKYAFSGDTKLKSIVIKSSSLKSVGKGALKNIYKKAVIKVPKKKLASYKKLLKNKGQAKTVSIKKR